MADSPGKQIIYLNTFLLVYKSNWYGKTVNFIHVTTIYCCVWWGHDVMCYVICGTKFIQGFPRSEIRFLWDPLGARERSVGSMVEIRWEQKIHSEPLRDPPGAFYEIHWEQITSYNTSIITILIFHCCIHNVYLAVVNFNFYLTRLMVEFYVVA